MEKASWVYTDPPTTNGCWLKWDYVWLRLHCRSQNVFWLSPKIQEYWILFLQALTKQASQLLLSWALQQSNSVFQALPSFPPQKALFSPAEGNGKEQLLFLICSLSLFSKAFWEGLADGHLICCTWACPSPAWCLSCYIWPAWQKHTEKVRLNKIIYE